MDFSSIFITVVIFVAPHVGGKAIGDVGCPPSFQKRVGQCYKLMDLQATWPEAKLYCQVIGGDLAHITNGNLQTIIADLVSKNHGMTDIERYWVDGSDMLQSRVWRWMKTNGNSVPFVYTNWHPGEPNNKKEKCVEVWYDWNSQWNDENCLSRRSFICQARATNGDEMKFNEEMDR